MLKARRGAVAPLQMSLRALFFLLNDLLLFLSFQIVLPIPPGIKGKRIFLNPGTAIVTEVIQPASPLPQGSFIVVGLVAGVVPEQHTLSKKICLLLACAVVLVMPVSRYVLYVDSCFCA